MNRIEFLSRQADLYPDLTLQARIAAGELVFGSYLEAMRPGAPAAQRGRTAAQLLTSNRTARKVDLLRGSTADQSGLPDFQD